MSAAISIHHVESLDCMVEPFAWPFAQEQESEIAAHWEKLCERQPALYDGRVLLMHACDIVPAGAKLQLRARHFETGFKSFIAWRDFGFPDVSVRNCFSMAALRGADGAFLLGVMGAHTSNAGQIYFPAGTPDPGDIVDGDRLDLAGSAMRELAEETGIDAGSLEVAGDWSIVDAGPRLGCMKLMQSAEDANSLRKRIETFLAGQDRPELSGIHIVRTRADLIPARMPEFMLAWLDANLP